MYLKDDDLSPIEDVLRPYIKNNNKLVLVRSYFEDITGRGRSPLLLHQENHCLCERSGKVCCAQRRVGGFESTVS